MVLLEKDCYQFMVRGSNLHKVKNSNSKLLVNTSLVSGGTPQHYSNTYAQAENPSQQSSSQISGKKFARSFKLDSSHNFISWSPSRKGQRYAQYEVRRFARIRRGLISVEAGTQMNSANSSTGEESSTNNSFARLGFTIIFVNGTTCELLASNAETVNYWVTGLRFLIYRSQQGINSHLPVEKERHVRTEFKTKSYGAQNLDFHSAIELFHDLTPLAGSLNLPYALERVFKHGRLISCNDFVSLFDNLTSVGLLLSIVFQYSVSGDLVLNISELASVLINEVSEITYGVASETALSALCRSVVSSFEVVPEYRQNLLLGVDGLTSFFFSRHCGLMDPRHLSVHQDMSRSLSSYYMNSSHNTFLTGSQLLGESSADMYTQLLTRGVRYVEIDVWDGEDGQPFCNHGYTLTSRIPFTHVIQAINQAAFVTSVYPVVIGLENHCSLTQQASLVQTMLSIFREKLFLPKEHSPSGVNVMDLPLNSLCCKILIKSKKLNRTSEFGSTSFLPHSKSEHGSIAHLSSNGHEEDENDERTSLYDKVPHAADDCNNSWGEVSDENSADELSDVYKVQPNLRRNEMNEIVEHLGAYDQRRKQHLLQGKAPTIALSSRMSKCVVLRSTALSKHTLRKLNSKNGNLLSKYSNPSIHNLPENQAVHVVREQYLELLSFSQNNLVSVSPSPTRIDSSNPELLQFWNGGVQIVALNQQTDDRMNKMNRSLFDANGSSGYFLKPKLLQTDVFNENQDFSCTKTLSMSFLYISIVDQVANYDVLNTSTTSSGNITSSSRSLSNHSMSSSQHSVAASSSQPEFCLRVEILGHPIDTSTHSFACNSKEELREGLRGVKLEYPDLAFMGFSVTDETSLQSRKVLAEFYIPVSSLAQGVRSINLTGKTPVSILCHVRVEEHVQPSKSSQFSLGILKRASFIKKSLKGSFRRSVGMTGLGPSNPAPQYDIPTTLLEGHERNVEAVSDRDSGFLSNSSMNSPSRIDKNESPETNQVGQVNSKSNIEPKARFPNQYTNVDPNQVPAQQRSSFALSEKDKLNIMLEEAAKAEVLLSAEHRKAKSLSMTDEMIRLESEESSPKPALPPKRYQSFRDKTSGDAKNDPSMRQTAYGNRFDSRKEMFNPPRPSSCTIDKNFSSNTSLTSSQRSLRKQSPSFLYSVSTPSSDTLYKVIEESNLPLADSSNDSNVVDNNSTRSSDTQGDVSTQLPRTGSKISFEGGSSVPDRRTGRDIVRDSWHGEPPELASAGMTASLNRTFLKHRSSQRSKYMNSTAIQKASFGFRNKMNQSNNAMSLNLETSVNIRKQPPVPPKCSLYTMEAERNRTSHPRSLNQGFDPNKSYSFIDSFCVTTEEPEKEESEMLELTTLDEAPMSDVSSSPPRFSANLFPRSRFESPQNSSDSPDLSVREGVLNLHEMSVSLPVESVNSSNAVKKKFENS